MTRQSILFATPEAAPIVKVGGLGDVAGALPKALRAMGHDVRIILPLYGTIDQKKFPSTIRWQHVPIQWGGQTVNIDIRQGALPETDVPVYYLDFPEQYAYGGAYLEQMGAGGLEPATKHFVFFSAAVVQVLPHLEWQPSVIHCHDWPTGLIPTLCRIAKAPVKTVFTIHNMENQGAWAADQVLAWLGLTGTEHPLLARRDAHGNLNLLQQGIVCADTVNTVSPSYAQELVTPEFGCGLEHDLQSLSRVEGILNGIDQGIFNPATDNNIAAKYTTDNPATGKRLNKSALQRLLRLPLDPATPLFVAVSRLTPQKGLDMIPGFVDEFASQGWQIAILGSGIPTIERAMRTAAERHPETFSATFRFDAKLAQLMYAAADFFLMPSRFEPCGLGQMIAMRYGTIPIVRAVGGLRDSVADLTASPDAGNGFVFQRADSADLHAAITRAVNVYHRPSALEQVRRRVMAIDWSWARSAASYETLYAKLANAPERKF